MLSMGKKQKYEAPSVEELLLVPESLVCQSGPYGQSGAAGSGSVFKPITGDY